MPLIKKFKEHYEEHLGISGDVTNGSGCASVQEPTCDADDRYSAAKSSQTSIR